MTVPTEPPDTILVPLLVTIRVAAPTGVSPAGLDAYKLRTLKQVREALAPGPLSRVAGTIDSITIHDHEDRS